MLNRLIPLKLGSTKAVCDASILGIMLCHCRANMAHTRQSRPDSALGFLVKVVNFLGVGPFPLVRGSSVVLMIH